jgi:hypothetical protein
LLIRLLGLEGEANSYTGNNPFLDVPDWGSRTAALAYELGLTVGVNSTHTLFDPNKPVTQQEFTAFLLRALGFTEKDGDFAFAEAVNKALAVELYSQGTTSYISNQPTYLRASAVVNMAEALLTPLKNSNINLLASLVEKGVIKQEEADKFVELLNRI